MEQKLGKAEDELRQLALIVESSTDAIFSVDLDGIITTWNPAAQVIYGYTAAEAVGMSISNLAPAELKQEGPAFLARVRTGERISGHETVRLRKDGSRRNVSLTVFPLRDSHGEIVRMTGIARDITVQKELEQKLQQARRMESIGRLAGGIAHDFNNLLHVIIGYTELLADTPGIESCFRRHLQQIHEAAQRAAFLTRQLLAFSRRQMLSFHVLDVNSIVSTTVQTLPRLLGGDVCVATFLDPALPAIKADPGQVEQLLVNLAVNARDAMPHGGQLTIETRLAELDEAYAATHADVVPGKYVMISVSDTGVGMDPVMLAHAFEPFFTTKGLGHGTGLGLSSVYGIVKQTGGHINAYSEPGHGTTFKIYFSVAPAPSESTEAPARRSATPADEATILIVEDQEGIRDLLAEMLRSCGYSVLTAPGGKEAIQLVVQYGVAIDLLLTDLMMPGMSGRKLAEMLTAERPGLKVLFMSGYAENAMIDGGVLQAGVEFLQKPVSTKVVADRVRRILAAPAA